MFKNFKCYIEEYTNGNSLCARLREYNANKQIVFLGEQFDKMHLLQFMSMCKKNFGNTYTSKVLKNDEYIHVAGDVVKEDDDKIFIEYNENTEYSII